MRSAIIICEESPLWLSSKVIRANILNSYKLLNPKIPVFKFEYGELLDSRLNQRFESFIKAKRVTRIIFAECFYPHPLTFLSAVLPQCPQILEFCFHIYGDFTLNAPEWLSLITFLGDRKTKFVVASRAHKKFIEVFFKPRVAHQIIVVPFPLTESQKPLTNSARAKLRSEFGFTPDDFVIIYAGRISLRKNVKKLIQFIWKFCNSHPESRKRIKLIIAGSFDDLGTCKSGGVRNNGLYKTIFMRWFDKLPNSLKMKVSFVGFQQQLRLKQMIQLSDLFISLSTFENEDFGVAPLQALLLGCPAILSRWGGYSDFVRSPNDIKFVDVTLKDRGLHIDYESFRKALEFFISQSFSHSRRIQCSRLYQQTYSFEAISRFYKHILDESWISLSQYSDVLIKYSKKIIKQRKTFAPIFKSHSSRDPLYKLLYSKYLITHDQ